MRWAIILSLGAASAGALGLWAWQQKASAQGFLPYTDAVAISEGAAIYVEACASCHGVNLEGQPDWRSPDDAGMLPAPPHNAQGHTWHHPDDLLFAITKHGSAAVVGRGYRSNMLGFGDTLSDGQIVAVLAYIKSTWPDRVIAAHNDINARSN